MSASSWKVRWSEPGVTAYESVGPYGRHVGLLGSQSWPVDPVVRARMRARLVALREPEVASVCPLVGWSPERSWLAYTAPESVSVAELVACLKAIGCAAGVRAGVELLQRLVRVLSAADGACGGPAGSGHGSLSAHRVLLDAGGRPHLLGWGVVGEGMLPPGTAGLRHAPPERPAGAPEDLSCDLFVAAMLAVELMFGRPIYAGSDAQVRQQAMRGLARRRLARMGVGLPPAVRVLLSELLQPRACDRPPRTGAVVARLDALINDQILTGPCLERITQMAVEKRQVHADGRGSKILRLPQTHRVATPTCTVPMRRVEPEVNDRTVAHIWRARPTRQTRRFELFDSHRGCLRSIELDRQLTVAEAVVTLSRTTLPPVFSATGQLIGWYAIRVDRRRLSWDQRIGDLDHAVVQLEAELVVGEGIEVSLVLPAGMGGRCLNGTVFSSLPLRWALAPLCAAAGVCWEDLTALTDGSVWVNGLLLSELAPIMAAGSRDSVRIDVHPAAHSVVAAESLARSA